MAERDFAHLYLEIRGRSVLGTIRDKNSSFFFAKTNRMKNREGEESPINTMV
jgi:hypothetical protein